MKKLFTAFTFFVICMTVLLLTGCQQPITKVEKTFPNTTTYVNTTTPADLPKDAKVYKVYPEPTNGVSSINFSQFNQMMNKSSSIMIPDLPEKALITIPGVDPATDLINGIVYYDNSFTADGIYHELDLSYIVGDKPSQIYLLMRWLDGCEDETLTVLFRPSATNSTIFGNNISMTGISVRGQNDPIQLVPILTNEHGVLQWYHNYTWQFNHSGVWKAKKYEIYAIYYSNGVVVNTGN